jgi:hypothetical protein
VAKRKNQESLDRAVKFLEESIPSHDKLIKDVERRSDAYHGVVKRNSRAAEWRSQVYGKYAMHIVETTLASLVEDKFRFKIRPRMTMADLQEPEAAKRLRIGAEAHQALFDWQSRQSKFTRMQRPFLLQNAIAGITVAKTYWEERLERRRRVISVDRPLIDDDGVQIVHPVSGPVTYASLEEDARAVTVYDGPVTDVIDVHDFFWPENARTVDHARYVAHRIRISREELEEGFKDGGPYGPQAGGWTLKVVTNDLGTSRVGDKDSGPRWSEKEQTHDKDLLEVVEVYDNLTKEVITFVNRRSLLAYSDKFPFFHERPPFVVCTTQADLFQIVGISQIEKVEALQTMLWRIQNQSLDNLELINNAIVMYRPDLEDADALIFGPGEMWSVEDPEQVKMWSPDPMPAEISLNREGLIKGDMQQLAGGFPFSSGAESQTVDQKTATGASIVTQLAQRSIDMAKQPVYDAWEDIGDQRLILNNQFIRETTLVTTLGLEGVEEVHAIEPELLAGDYKFELEPIPDAVMKQQNQASAQAMVQIFQGLAPIQLQLAAQGMASMINFDAIIKYYLKSLDIEDTEQFFLAKQPTPQQGQAMQPPGQGTPQAPPEQTLGITAGEGGNAPGSQLTASPDQNMQSAAALAGGGGGVNV